MKISKRTKNLQKFSGKTLDSLMGDKSRSIKGERSDLEKKLKIFAHRFSLEIIENTDNGSYNFWIQDGSGCLMLTPDGLYWEKK